MTVWSVAIVESGSANDNGDTTAIFVSAVSESRFTTDILTAGASRWVGSITEAGTASDITDEFVTRIGFSIIPAGSTNGTPIGNIPSGAMSLRIYLSTGSSVTFTVATTQPLSPPGTTFTASAASTGAYWDEPLSSTAMLYILSTVGSPTYRWIFSPFI